MGMASIDTMDDMVGTLDTMAQLIDTVETSMRMDCATVGLEWNDPKYQELEEAVAEICSLFDECQDSIADAKKSMKDRIGRLEDYYAS